jgi:hypothetical protein
MARVLCVLWYAAATTCAVAHAAPPKSAEAQSREATALWQKGDRPAAMKAWHQCLRQDSKYCPCVRGLATAYREGKTKDEFLAVMFMQALLDKCADDPLAAGFADALATQPPRAPASLGRCEAANLLKPMRDMPRKVGEGIRYLVAINGISVGKIDVKIERQGQFNNQSVTEYRTTFDIDSLVATFVTVKGRAAALVQRDTFLPVTAMNRYQARGFDVSEDLEFAPDGRAVRSVRDKNGEREIRARRYPYFTMDFLTAFYGLRTLPREVQGCATFFSSGVIYTVWIRKDGEEPVKTPIGYQNTDRYFIKYAPEVSRRRFGTARLWLSQDDERIPYKAEVLGEDTLEATIHIYERGK